MDIHLFLMSKNTSERGDLKIEYNWTNKTAIAQWHTNRVVTILLTLGVKGKISLGLYY